MAILVMVIEEAGLADEHRARFAEFLAEVGDQPMNVLLLEGKGFDIFALYKVERIPTYILIDEQGVIAWTKEGLVDEQDLRAYVRSRPKRKTIDLTQD